MSEPLPFRLRVLRALTDELQRITPTNGYSHDLTNAVFRGREVFGDNDPLPMVSILDSITEREQLQPPPEGETTFGGWDLLIQGFVDDDRLHPTDPGHLLMAEVKKRLIEIQKGGPRNPLKPGSRNILGFGDAIDGLMFSPGVVRPQDDLSDKAYFWLRLTIKMAENQQDPYA